jgi:hypothetical protein
MREKEFIRFNEKYSPLYSIVCYHLPNIRVLFGAINTGYIVLFTVEIYFWISFGRNGF